MFLVNRSPKKSSTSETESNKSCLTNMASNNDALILGKPDYADPFRRTTVTGHSPKKHFENSPNRISVNPTLVPTLVESPLKRKSDVTIERSNDDIYTFMKNMNQQMNNNFKSIETKMNQNFGDLEKRLNVKIDEIEGKIESVNVKADNNSKLINWMQQEKLQNKMEIDGLKIDGSVNKSEVKAATLKFLHDLGLKVNSDEIKAAQMIHVSISKTDRTTKPIIVVEFESLDVKIRVMRDKKLKKEQSGVFFDNCLTPVNRSLMGKLKKITKPKNFTVYIRNNRIFAKKSSVLFRPVECEEDIDVVATWPANINVRENYINKQSSSSSKI